MLLLLSLSLLNTKTPPCFILCRKMKIGVCKSPKAWYNICMKILVLSDTHYKTDNAKHVIERVRPTHIFHLGDMTADASDIKKAYPDIQMHAVRGNNDFSPAYPHEKIVELFGQRFFLTHGHKYNVKSGPELLARRARDVGAAYALFGHTHLPFDGVVGGVRLLNPSSYGYILIENERYEVYNY